MQVREVRESELWNGFIAKSPTGDLLQSFEWGELKRRSGGWQPIRLAVEDAGDIVGAASILKRKLPHLNECIFYAPRGPVCDFSDQRALPLLIDAVRDRARHDGAILFKIDPPVTTEDSGVVRLLRETGFVSISDPHGFGGVQPRCVMQLDLTPSPDELLANCKPKWRYNIRLAERKGVRVRSSCTKDDLRVFYDLLRETARRDRFLIRGYDYYESIWNILVEAGYAKLFLAEYEGKAIAGALSFVFGNKCWYTYGASSNRHRNVMPNHLLQWRMIEWAKESGCVLYDFRGVSPKKDWDADDRLSGLNRFKEGFGARFVEYIGEFDLPFSRVWYWAWSVGKPLVAGIIKSLGRRRTGVTGDGL
ncbi:MAG TPA: peptidoglycan bridge formation glycyltransferase FemA/FemB family protein [Armatimonadota bacterium]|nr:peptidoglycan bridge formation glycyltransferase FemA/FemB family protein [Armatimonadota bacterium]